MNSADCAPQLLVVALGGNALVRTDQPVTAAEQRAAVARSATVLAPLAAESRLVVSHGNGPQVGMLARGSNENAEYPLDILDAETAGMIGYLIEQELGNRLAAGDVATLLTQVEVDPRDPAFREPIKPVGPTYGRQEAERLARERGWCMAQRNGDWRRLVASPRPRRVPCIDVIRMLSEAGVIVICAGGGGIPAVRDDDGGLMGVEAVVDKDWVTALIARELGADFLLLLTDVEGVWEHRDESNSRLIREASPGLMKSMALDEGSMGPKVEAACEFVEATGVPAAIGLLEQAAAILRGESGTRISNRTGGITYW